MVGRRESTCRASNPTDGRVSPRHALRRRDAERPEVAKPSGVLALVRDRATPGLRGVALLVCAVARADERPGEHGAEAERLALLAEPAELVGVHPAVDRRVLRARLQVLADGDDVDSV